MDILKIKKILFSTKNMVGCGLASVAIILAMVGILKTLWLPITVMCYIFGYIAGPAEKEIKFHHYKGESLDDYVGFINKVNNIVAESTKLPFEAKNVIKNIIQNATELLTFLQKGDKLYSLDEDLLNLTSIFDAYLPKIINQYERLPSKYANEVKSMNGKTAKTMLVEQLTLLEQKVQEIAYGMYENDVTALRANGNFLKEKFGRSNLFELEMNAE